MSNTWLCFRRRLLQTLQFRYFSSLSWFQNRNTAVSLDSDVLLENDSVLRENFKISSDATPDKRPLLLDGFYCSSPPDKTDLQHNTFQKNGKFDVIAIINSLGAKNQELMNSLSKIIEPAECKDTIHIGKNTCGIHDSYSLKNRNNFQISAFRSFDLFTTLDPNLVKDSLVRATAVKRSELEVDQFSDTKQTASDRKEGKDEPKGPTLAQLETVRSYYLEIVPDFHKRGEDLSAKLHSQNLVFENHFFKTPRITRGLQKYMMELAKFRILGAIAYPSYYFEIQSITSHPREGQVKMHWRMYYVSNWNFVRRIFSLMRDMSEKKKGHDSIDATSTFSVNKDGKIFYHKVDRVIPLQEEVSPVEKIKAKTAEMVGFAPKTPFDRPSNDPV